MAALVSRAGLGHCNIRGGLSGLLETETLTLFLLQSLGGAFWAVTYLSTGDLAVPVVGHTVYDLAIFFGAARLLPAFWQT